MDRPLVLDFDWITPDLAVGGALAAVAYRRLALGA
jgi:hypothetical protein